jgi:hypothetical protein
MRWRENLRVVALNVISHETKARGARRSSTKTRSETSVVVVVVGWGRALSCWDEMFYGNISTALGALANRVDAFAQQFVLSSCPATWTMPRCLFTYQICPESVLPLSEKGMVFFVAMAKRKIPFF